MARLLWSVVILACYLLLLGVLIRVVTETVRSFARSWRPVGVTAVGLEVVYTITDPPIRALRRVIPPLRLGAISLDLSVLVLFIAIFIVRTVAFSFLRA